MGFNSQELNKRELFALIAMREKIKASPNASASVIAAFSVKCSEIIAEQIKLDTIQDEPGKAIVGFKAETKKEEEASED